MYSAATGMNVSAQTHEITADNLAHVGVAGYRQRGVVFETFDRVLQQAGVESPPRPGSQVAQGYVDFRPGGYEQTKEPFDLALGGDGFFVLQGPNGPVYTRDGVFQRAADGRVLSTGGLPLLGARGPITIPRQASNVVVGSDGALQIDGVPGDRLQLARFERLDQLVPVGTALFAAPDGTTPLPSTATVQQGVREKSNVELATAMTSMIRDLRYFEASQRALRTISEATALVTRP